ncbi:PilN domain-containing protein [Nevskia soli]|uniref:PilN domain-containing protein n=1 Tax=Nevskia soli TaxID=418856 RepID=UPI0004A74944|nr:PilN domain-containing protein [Nevskia soli]
MTKINLLDWRAERRQRRKQQFMLLLGITFLASAALVGIAYFAMDEAISHQQDRNKILQTEIAALDKQIKEIQELQKVKANLLARMRVIEQLQQSRSATVHFFDEIINTLPDGVYLTSIKQTGTDVTLDGVAESNGRISAYMKNLDSSPWFKDPKLVVIRTSDKNRLRSSEFQLKVTNLTKATDSSQPAAGAPRK